MVITGYLLQVPQHVHAQPVQRMFNHFLSTHYNDDGQFDNNGPASLAASAAQEQYDDRAYPYGAIDYSQATNAYRAFQSITHRLNSPPFWSPLHSCMGRKNGCPQTEKILTHQYRLTKCMNHAILLS